MKDNRYSYLFHQNALPNISCIVGATLYKIGRKQIVMVIGVQWAKSPQRKWPKLSQNACLGNTKGIL